MQWQFDLVVQGGQYKKSTIRDASVNQCLDKCKLLYESRFPLSIIVSFNKPEFKRELLSNVFQNQQRNEQW